MLSILIDKLVTNPKIHQKLVRYTFFAFQGLLAGILLNDTLRIFYGDFDGKENFQYGLSAFVGAVPFIVPQMTLMDHRTNNVSLGAGMALGTYMANRTENKEPIVEL